MTIIFLYGFRMEASTRTMWANSPTAIAFTTTSTLWLEDGPVASTFEK